MSIKVIPGELNVQATNEDFNFNVGKEFNVNAGDNITIKTSAGIITINGDVVIVRSPQIELIGNLTVTGDFSVTGSHPFALEEHGVHGV